MGQVEVEKELGFKSKRDIIDYGVEKFVQLCKDRVEKYSKIQTEQSKRLGIGWIGTIHIIRCLTKIITQFGHF